MIIPKSVVTEFNFRVVILSLVLERASEVFFGKTLSGVAIEVLFAFPYQLAFLVVGFYGGAYSITNLLLAEQNYYI